MGKLREIIKEQGLKVESQDSLRHQGLVSSISFLLLIRLPWEWVTKLSLLGLNEINSTSMLSFLVWYCMILVSHDIDVILDLYAFNLMDLNCYWKIPFESRLE